jgi:hypothetical protein
MLDCFKCLPDEECYLNLPDNMTDTNPLDTENIKEQQDADHALLQHGTKYADQYMRKRIDTFDDRKNCSITITLLLCKLIDSHQTCLPPITSPKWKMYI